MKTTFNQKYSEISRDTKNLMIHTVRSVVAEIQEVFNRFPQSTWRTRTQKN